MMNVVDQVRSHVINTPDAIAVQTISNTETTTADRSDQGSMTYGELWAVSSKLSSQIRNVWADTNNQTSTIHQEQDNDPTTSTQAKLETQHTRNRAIRVVTFVEEGWELPVTFLSVLRSGAAFVPLAITDPVDRLHRAIADCAPSVVIHATYQRKVVLERLAGLNIPMLDVGSELRTVPKSVVESEVLLATTAATKDSQEILKHEDSVEELNDDEAYIIFTSGSTGNPKGVVIGHAALASYCSARVCSTRDMSLLTVVFVFVFLRPVT